MVLNFGSEMVTLDLSAIARCAEIALATELQRHGAVELAALNLAGHEGLVLRLVQ